MGFYVELVPLDLHTHSPWGAAAMGNQQVRADGCVHLSPAPGSGTQEVSLKLATVAVFTP